ncbi:MAG: fused MFS/spermidine synthase [Chloroflexi bacterium]|nr:fused MFS/spermidine synthase [Chloroflexota bacterium]
MTEQTLSHPSTNIAGSAIRRWFVPVAVFASGATTLAVEMAAFRLMGSVFGSSNLIWANIIGMILLYLTVGYYVGGRWADRSPHATTFYRIIMVGAFLCALVPFIARPVLTAAANAVVSVDAGVAVGSFLAVIVLFAVPITLLGTISPFAIRLIVIDVSGSGRAAGRLYAISTLGSLVGTFLSVLVTIPELGTTPTFVLFAAILFVVGILGQALHAGWRGSLSYLLLPLIVVVMTFTASAGPLRDPLPGATLLYEDESAYNYIQVQETSDGYRYLYLNEGQGIHSEWHPTLLGSGRTWDFFLVAPYFNAAPFAPQDVESMLIVGLAAGTIARQYTQVYGGLPIDGIEIDPAIVDAAAQFFDLNQAMMPNVNVIVEDGRYALRGVDRRYTVAAIDAYRPPYIPWHLTTAEFFQEVRARLTPDGVVAINVGRTPQDRRLVQALTTTLLEVFPTVHTIDVPLSFNTILVATQEPTTFDDFVRNFDALPSDAHPLLRSTFERALESVVPTSTSDIVFTDERAPLETIVDSLVVNFLLSGGAEQLR